MEETIRRILAEHGQLAVDAFTISVDDDLYVCGMTSHASVSVMLGLEDEFDFEFPERLLRKSSFATVRALEATLVEAGVETVV